MRGHAFSRGGDVCRARGGELQSREVNKQRDGHISRKFLSVLMCDVCAFMAARRLALAPSHSYFQRSS